MFFCVLLIFFEFSAVHSTTYPAENTRYNEKQIQEQTPDISSISKNFTASIARERELNRTISFQQREFVKTIEILHERFSEREKEWNRTMEQLKIHFETREKELNRTWHVQLELQQMAFEGRESVFNETVHNKIEQCKSSAVEWNKTTHILKQDLKLQRDEFKRTLELQQQMSNVREQEYNKTIETQRRDSLNTKSHINKTIEKLSSTVSSHEQQLNRMLATQQAMDRKQETYIRDLQNSMLQNARKLQNYSDYLLYNNNRICELDENINQTKEAFDVVFHEMSEKQLVLERSLSDILLQMDNFNNSAFNRTAWTEANLMNLRNTITGLKQSIQDEQNNIAFTVSKTGSGALSQQKIIYNKVVTNVGYAYSTKTGVFTCPRGGVYVFTWSTMSRRWTEDCYAYIYRNGVRLLMTHSYEGMEGTTEVASNTAVLSLTTGDRVWIQTSTCGYFWGYPYTAFSGWKL